MSIRTIQESDAVLLDGIVQANAKQVKKLYSEYLPGITRYIVSNNGLESDAMDIFQEAVLVIYKKAKSGALKLEVPLQSYLFAICRNLWLAQIRNKKHKPMATAPEESPDLDADTIKKIETVQKEQLFHKHFTRLGEKCQSILRDFFNKVPMKEMAARYNSSESYIKKRKHLCKEQLISAIQNDPVYNEIIL